jgi:hypothetical protein
MMFRHYLGRRGLRSTRRFSPLGPVGIGSSLTSHIVGRAEFQLFSVEYMQHARERRMIGLDNITHPTGARHEVRCSRDIHIPRVF